jgi:hypothetical protein
MQAVDSGTGAGQVSADDATVTQEGDWFHVQVAGRKISFSKNGDFEFDGQSVTIPEDINLDGIVDIQDIHLCADVILGFETNSSIVQRADVNTDGKTNAMDIQLIVIASQ